MHSREKKKNVWSVQQKSVQSTLLATKEMVKNLIKDTIKLSVPVHNMLSARMFLWIGKKSLDRLTLI